MNRVKPLLFILLAAACSVAETREEGGLVELQLTPSIGFIGASPAIGVQALLQYALLGLALGVDQATGEQATFYPVTVNLEISLGNKEKVVPFAVLGGGMMLTIPQNLVDAKTVTSLGFNFGGGFKYYWSERLGFQFEARQLFTEIRNQAEIRELFIFFHNRIGIILRF